MNSKKGIYFMQINVMMMMNMMMMQGPVSGGHCYVSRMR